MTVFGKKEKKSKIRSKQMHKMDHVTLSIGPERLVLIPVAGFLDTQLTFFPGGVWHTAFAGINDGLGRKGYK